MNWTLIFYYMLIAILHLHSICGQELEEGDRCNLSNGKIGVCTNVSKCASALEQIKKYYHPETCIYIGKTPIVCCELDQLDRIKFKPTKPGQVSDLKCHEYANNGLRKVPINDKNGTVYEERCLFRGNLEADAQQRKLELTSSKSKGPNDELSVIGGMKAKLGQYPHAVAIGYGQDSNIQYHCGGSLISEYWILTAAHCSSSASLGVASYARLGFVDFTHSSLTIQIEERIRHPNYTSTSLYNDIMLMKLLLPPPFSFFLRPGCLRTNPVVTEQTTAISGWGVTDWRSYKTSDVLQRAFLNIYNKSICDQIYNQEYRLNKGVDSNTQMCVGFLEGGQDSCIGDSGGGILLNNPNEECMFDILGVTSFGSKFCGTRNTAGLYTRVYAYLDWIERIVWPEYFK